jgi:hypothetical protein
MGQSPLRPVGTQLRLRMVIRLVGPAGSPLSSSSITTLAALNTARVVKPRARLTPGLDPGVSTLV